MPSREEVLTELENVFELIRQEWEADGKNLPVDVELIHATGQGI
jgi:hypothetical protein